MTDLELIQLLQQKSAGELSPDEVEAIRARWTQSPDLRQALVEHLHLESKLTGALGPVHLDVDMILRRASEQRSTQRVTLPRWSWIVGLGLLLAIGTGLTLFFNIKPSNPDSFVDSDGPPTATPSDALSDPALPDKSEEKSSDSALVNTTAETPRDPTETASTTIVPHPIPKPAEVVANEPWSAGLSRDVAPWPANSAKLATEYKSAGHDEFPESEARRWFAQVEGQPFNWSTDSIGNPARRISKFQGLSKLRAPWSEDAVLRITPMEVTDLTLYFWRGPTGIALRFYTRREPHLWAAFEISRENSSPRPSQFGLLSTDSGTYSRSTPGMLDIRQQNGELVLARGGLILLSVPFVNPPLEVYVEGQFRLRGLSMFRSAPFVKSPENPHPILISDAGAKIPWALSAENPAGFEANPDGSVSMTTIPGEKTGLISFPFGWLLATQQSPRANGLFEVVVNIETADPGTGIFLGDRDGRPLQQIGFFRDAATQQITFGILRPGEGRTESNYNSNDFPPPYLAKSVWLKLVAGLGTLHVLTSGDGHQWGHVVESPGRDLPGAVASMGLFGLPGSTARTIRLRQIQIRELNGITDLADPRLRILVLPFTNDDWKDAVSWNHRVFDRQPVGVETDAWFTACAVAALSQGPPKEFGLNLLRQLVSVGLRSTRSFEQKRQLLDDACSLCDLFDDGAAKSLGSGYEELGWQLAEAGQVAALSKTRAAWLWSPIWTSSKMRYVWERLNSYEILQAIYRRDWPSAWTAAQSAGYWNLLPHPDQKPTEKGEDLDRHARWAKALVAEVAPQLDDRTADVMPIGWRHPLAPVLNKETYNVRAELQSALSGQTYEDACRIMMSIAEHDEPGLLPDPEDRQLYVSLATAIADARTAHPGFAQAMTEKFEPLGQIRVQSAMNRGDIASLQVATLQFMGTDAARNAHLSLGDIALSVGQFDMAEQHFRDALVDAGLRWKAMLEPRLLLARALGGRLSAAQYASIAASVPAHSLDINGKTISPEEFRGILSDLVSRSTASNLLVETIRQSNSQLPLATYQLEPRAQFDGHPGNNPGRWEYRYGDPFGRQLAVVADEQRIYVSNRFQINAYSVNDGTQIWAQGLGSEQGEAYGLPFTPMQPLLAGDRLFVRRLTKAGAELACLKVDDGEVIWHQRPSQSVLTDPVIWNGRLFALTLVRIDEDLMQVEASWFDPKSGHLSAPRPLFRFRETTDRTFSGQLTVNDRLAVCTVAGTTASFDARGEMRWLRRSTFLQKPADELAEDARVAAPVIQSGRVITTMPGVREVSCLDLDSGNIVWELPIFNLRGLVSATDSRVVVETVTGLISLDAITGKVVWRRPIDTRLEAMKADAQTIVVTRRSTFPNNRSKPVLIWLDLQSGEELAQSLIDIPEREECQLGPLFSAGGKWWTFVGQTWKDPKRELNELVNRHFVVPKPFLDQTRLAWKSEIPDAQLAEIQSVVPGWFPVANYRERLSIAPGDLRGEVFSLISKIDPQNQVRFTSRIHVAEGRTEKLRLRVGNQPGQKWKLTLRAANRTLFEGEIEDAGSQNGWRDVSVDLSPLAGQDISLHLIQSTTTGTADALWKRAELVIE